MKTPIAVLLAAGRGTRLAPLSGLWPKCLMPVGRRPLLDYWLFQLGEVGVPRVFVNTHAHAKWVESYLDRHLFAEWVTPFFEPQLLGTAGTIRGLGPYLDGGPVLVAHADNLIQCDLRSFISAHDHKDAKIAITMMTFTSPSPETCGIVQLDRSGVVVQMDEKPTQPRSSLANGAVYIFEPEVLNLINSDSSIVDLSTDLLPRYMGRIQSWYNSSILRDIGTIEQLASAQRDSVREPDWPDDSWQMWFSESEVLREIRGWLEP